MDKNTYVLKRNLKERISDSKEVVVGYSKKETIEEAPRRLRYKRPRRVLRCPALLVFQNFLIQYYICERVYPHYCEKTCVKLKKLVIIYVMKKVLDIAQTLIKKLPLLDLTAGLATAYFLRQKRHKIVAYEQKHKLGRMIIYVLDIPFQENLLLLALSFYDVVRVAKRRGCEVFIVYRRSEYEIPATSSEIEEAITMIIPCVI
ncbi:hypothetical protein EDI_066710 [Entamoeba dispar SAW760]|uniref:Uncharacterized protein n=1 Tax=Entamoeba dispar (strain ATCC PRA-260 / SAW760) TaxID=370354 RepID=B0EAX1_ENTDS|nr:uncharacterized protein EDI_066710 [Entamoeba dispar SAW760]EDR28339.1 hypothetical protein EDI_066710 [Entamoeba dispar SAW760]|eukprot:EDR28339.1 hypothetical protein EDI_066710 [Entamoeba dispar SAW760]